MADEVADAEQLVEIEQRIDAWLRAQLAENPMVVALELGERDEHRWYLRVQGEQKEVFTIWWTLHQRTLHYETYVLPAPEEHVAETYEFVLRRNKQIFGAAFCIGDEDALYLRGQVLVQDVDDDTLDRILGTLWEWTERTFRPAMRLAFGSRFSS